MRIVIAGAGEVGSHLAKMLRVSSNEVTVIDNDEQRLSRLTAIADVDSLLGSPSSITILKKANVASADLFVAVYPRSMQEINVLSALLAKQLGSRKVIARVNDEDSLAPENKLMFKEMGIELMFCPERMASEQIVDSLRHATSCETMDFAHGKIQMVALRVDEDCELMDMNLSEAMKSIGEDSQKFRFIAVIRGEKTLIPGFDTKFMYHDIVYAISTRDGVPVLMRLFGENDVDVRSVMIYGGGSIAEMVARSLAGTMTSVKIIDNDKENCYRLSERLGRSVTVSLGDGRNSDFLLDEGIKDCDAFIALTDSDETNVLACVAARKFGVGRTVAEVENIEYIRLAEDMGVDVVINKKLITAGRIFRFTLSSRARSVKYINGTDAEILEYTAAPGSRITKCPLKSMNFPQDVVVGGVIRGSESIIAVGDTVIEAYDRVIVFALGGMARKVDAMFK